MVASEESKLEGNACFIAGHRSLHPGPVSIQARFEQGSGKGRGESEREVGDISIFSVFLFFAFVLV